jgi:hypothetical protein
MLPSRLLAIAAVVTGATGATGCGGGGGDAPKTPVTVTIFSTAALDGDIHSTGYEQVGPNYHIALGDYANAQGPVSGVRAFTSFDVSVIPSNATVQSATLSLYLKNSVGSPFATLGTIVVDHVVYGNVLEAGAYSRSGLGDAIATLPSDVIPGYKTVSVTSAVAFDVASHAYSQYRIRFTIETDNDGDSDGVAYYSSGQAPTQDERPKLIVTYLR